MENLNYELRPYENQDYYFVYDAKKITYKKYVEEFYGEWNEQFQQNMYINFIKERAKNIQIIIVNNENAGFIDTCNLNEKEFELGNICIIPAFQGKGVGTKILKDVLNENKNKNIYLRVFKTNPAQNLYARLGFTYLEETKTHFNMVLKTQERNK